MAVDLKKELTRLLDPMLAPPIRGNLQTFWALVRINKYANCSACKNAISIGDVIWARQETNNVEFLHNCLPCKQKAEDEFITKKVPPVAEWIDGSDTRTETALVVARLGGFGSLVDLVEDED